jgi:bifunctional non-homologous end joining protein LigD
MRAVAQLEVEGRTIPVSNLDKVLYPATGFTKGDLIRYYIEVAPFLLPHLRGRAVTLKRYPNGVSEPFFYEKTCPAHHPPWVKTQGVWSEERQAPIDYCTVADLPTLVWLANLADIELHTFLALAKKPLHPTMMVFDLDPGAPADIVQSCEVALRLRDLLTESGLESFAKTSGSKGLQVYVPLNTPATFEVTKAFAHSLAENLEREHPELIVSRMQKILRKGKVFIDWSQNDDHKTTVCVYSLRAKDRPTVSMPVTWDEVRACGRSKDAESLVFNADAAPPRLQKLGDLFAPLLTQKQRLPRAAGRNAKRKS